MEIPRRRTIDGRLIEDVTLEHPWRPEEELPPEKWLVGAMRWWPNDDKEPTAGTDDATNKPDGV